MEPGAGALANTLKTNTSLKTLGLASNVIGEIPAERWDVRSLLSLPEPVASRVRHSGFVSTGSAYITPATLHSRYIYSLRRYIAVT